VNTICKVVGPLLCRDGRNHIAHVLLVGADSVIITPAVIDTNESAAKRQRKTLLSTGTIDADLAVWIALVRWAAVYCGQEPPSAAMPEAQGYFEPERTVRWSSLQVVLPKLAEDLAKLNMPNPD